MEEEPKVPPEAITATDLPSTTEIPENSVDLALADLQAGLNGDEKRFKKFILESTPRFEVIAFRLNKDRGPVEDLLQTFFLKLWQQRDYFTGKEITWALLSAIFRNTVIDGLRRENLKNRFVKNVENDSLVASQAPNPEETHLLREELKRVRKKIEELPSTQQNALLAKLQGGQDDHEISEAIGMPVGTIKRALFNLRKKLGIKSKKVKPRGASLIRSESPDSQS